MSQRPKTTTGTRNTKTPSLSLTDHKDKKNGLYVAIKEIIKERFDNPQEILKRHVEIMKKLKNENSVNLKEVIETNDYFY